MEDIHEGRRHAVLRVIHDLFDGNRAAFARAANESPTYLTRALRAPDEPGERKNIGEEKARKWEDALAAKGFKIEPDAFVCPGGSRNNRGPQPTPAPPPPTQFMMDTRTTDEMFLLSLWREMDAERQAWLKAQAKRLAAEGRPWPANWNMLFTLLERLRPDEQDSVCTEALTQVKRMLDRPLPSNADTEPKANAPSKKRQ